MIKGCGATVFNYQGFKIRIWFSRYHKNWMIIIGDMRSGQSKEFRHPSIFSYLRALQFSQWMVDQILDEEVL